MVKMKITNVTLIKLVLSLILDYGLGGILAVFPILNEVISIVNTFAAIMLWGPTGILAAWEVLNPLEPLDAAVPSVFLCGLITIIRGES